VSGVRWDGDDLVLDLRVQPRAASDGLDVLGERLKLRITAPPVDGRANRHIIRYLARILGVAKSAVAIEAGENGRDKRVRVRGADPERAARLPVVSR
jgi:uncharacterized protein (TIGR00251 family)